MSRRRRVFWSQLATYGTLATGVLLLVGATLAVPVIWIVTRLRGCG